MKAFRLHFLALAALLALAMETAAAIVTVNFNSGDQMVYNSDMATVLTGGTTSDGDGAVLQLGYFSMATSANPFAGTWTPLTGEGGANSGFATTSVGDTTANGALSGTFGMNLVFDTTDSARNVSLPAAGIPLGIRIYNAPSIGGSTHYMTISSTATSWQWLTPADAPGPALTLSLNASDLRLEDGTPAGSAVGTPTGGSFSTTVPVPEPSAFALQAMVALAASCMRNRSRRRR